jgi:cell wall assembly regulator SMI1
MKERVKEVVDQLLVAIEELREREESYKDLRPAPFPPASKKEIAEYELYLGHPLPPSYKAFLELYNGYKGLTVAGDMLSIRSVMPGGEQYEIIKRWKTLSARYGSGEVIDATVIASMGSRNKWIYLDPNRPTSQKELTVIQYEPEDSDEYNDLIEFFKDRIEYCKFNLDQYQEENTE